MMRVDLTGEVFGRLTVVRRTCAIDGQTKWTCLCECGVYVDVWPTLLKRGETKSCGCLRRDVASKLNVVHGKHCKPEYKIWQAMKRRCRNTRSKGYKNYGGRGICVCPRWLNSFDNFYADMGQRPVGMTIERIDNNAGYSSDNCVWATRLEQARNTRRNTRHVAFGMKMLLTDWAKLLNTTAGHICQILKRGRTIEWLASRRGVFIQELV